MIDTFETRVQAWNDYMQTPWGRLQNSTRLFNLRKHIGAEPLDILDAGGGNGVETMPLAVEQHRLTLLDSSAAMLDDGVRLSAENNTSITTIQGSVLDLDSLVQPASYDLILLHNVIQYLDEAEVPKLIASMYRALRKGGMLSLVSVNRHSATLAKAIAHAEFEEALAQLDSKHQYSRAFDHTVRVYTAEEISTLLSTAGFSVTNHYGIRVFIDYIADNDIKEDIENYAKIEALERQLTDKFPYKHLARTFQLIGTRA